MAHYLVKAKLTRLADLKVLVNGGGIRAMRPFGDELQSCLQNARVDADGYATWEENCYCTPPLAQERAALLDNFFTELETKTVQKGEGWKTIEALPSLW